MKGYFRRIAAQRGEGDPARRRRALVAAAFSEQPVGEGRRVPRRARRERSPGRPREPHRRAGGDASSSTAAEQRIDTPTVVWAAGVQAAGFAKTLAEATGAETDRAGRLQIGADLTVPGHPEISVIGDATPGRRTRRASAARARDGRDPAGAARRARRSAAGQPRSARGAFRYFDKGALAVVGRGKAICEIRGHELSGRPAFFTYLTVHMYYLSGGGPGHRLKVLIDWISTASAIPRTRSSTAELDSIRTPPGAGPDGRRERRAAVQCRRRRSAEPAAPPRRRPEAAALRPRDAHVHLLVRSPSACSARC